MKSLLSLGVISMALACSSGTTTTGPSPAPTDTGTPAPAATAPNGIAYPTTSLGHSLHDRIPNLKFVGFKAADPGTMLDPKADLNTVQLADFYDPTGTKYKLIHLTAASVWCHWCNDETSGITGYGQYDSNGQLIGNTRTGPGIAADLAPKGVVFLQVLIDGIQPGISATTADLRQWVTDHQSNFTETLDPGYGRSGPTEVASFFLGGGIPWNADIDARSMEILDVNNNGFDSNLEANENTWLAWIDAHPPMAN